MLARAINDRHGIAITLGNLGDILRCRGSSQQAIEHYAESLALFRTIGDQHGTAWALYSLGQVAVGQGDLATAAEHFKASLTLCSELGAKVGIAYGLAGLAGVAVARGHWVPAAQLLGAVDALLENIQGRMNAADRAAYAHHVTIVTAALQSELLQVAWHQGRSYSLEQAIGEALRHRGSEACHAPTR